MLSRRCIAPNLEPTGSAKDWIFASRSVCAKLVVNGLSHTNTIRSRPRTDLVRRLRQNCSLKSGGEVSMEMEERTLQITTIPTKAPVYLQATGLFLLRYGLAAMTLLFGLQKWTKAE